MQITTLLLEPALAALDKELRDLAVKVPQGKNLSSHNQKLLDKICALISDLSGLKKKVSLLTLQNGGQFAASFYSELRRLKQETHFAGRTFLKLKSNETRFEKTAVRRNDVSTVAA